MDDQPSDEDVRRFVLEATRQRVAYLKYIKSRGYTVNDEQIAELEEEIRREEENLGESQMNSIGPTAVAELERQRAFVDLYAQVRSNRYLQVLILRRGLAK